MAAPQIADGLVKRSAKKQHRLRQVRQFPFATPGRLPSGIHASAEPGQERDAVRGCRLACGHSAAVGQCLRLLFLKGSDRPLNAAW